MWFWGQPGDVVVGFVHSASAAQSSGFRSWAWTYTLLISHVVAAPHIQNRGRLVQMLAQGQSSSPKKRKKKKKCSFNIYLVI